MSNINPKKRNFSRVAVMLTTLGFTVLLSVTTWSLSFLPTSLINHQKKPDTYSQRKEKLRTAAIAIENRTNSFEVVSVNKAIERGIIVLTLRNHYPRPMTGYKFGVGDSIEYTERLNAQWVQPGEEVREFLPLQVGLDVKGIMILAVILDDGTTDGDPRYVNEIRDRREGARIQRRHALSLLRGLITSQDADLDTALSNAESQLGPLSADESRGLSADKVAGMNSERYIALQELSRIKSGPSGQGNRGGFEVESSARGRATREALNKFIEELSRRL